MSTSVYDSSPADGVVDEAAALENNPSACPVGDFVKDLNADGSLICDTPTVTANMHTDDYDADTDNVVDLAEALESNPSACPVGDFVKDLNADGSLICDTPAGGGDMNQSTYDSNFDNIVDEAEALEINPGSCFGSEYVKGMNQFGQLTCSTPAAGSGGDMYKVTYDNVPQDNIVDKAAALENSPGVCPGDEYVKGMTASGALTCNTPTGSGGGAPTDAEYWVGTNDATLTAEILVNNMATLESAVGSPNIIVSTEINSKAKLEAIVGDATFADDNLGDNSITELNDINTLLGTGTVLRRSVNETPGDGNLACFNAGGNFFDCGPPGTGGAPGDAHYWTDRAEGGLSAEVVVNDEASLEAALGSIDVFTAGDGSLDEDNLADDPITNLSGINGTRGSTGIIRYSVDEDASTGNLACFNANDDLYDCGPPGTGGAPGDAHYWTDRAEGGLSAEVVVNDEASLETALGAINVIVATDINTAAKINNIIGNGDIDDDDLSDNTAGDLAFTPDNANEWVGTVTNIDEALEDIAGYGLVYTARAFGATGNGTTDDSNALEDCTDAADTGGVSNICYLHCGTYKTSHVAGAYQTWRITGNDVSLIGANRDCVEINNDGATSGGFKILTVCPVAKGSHCNTATAIQSGNVIREISFVDNNPEDHCSGAPGWEPDSEDCTDEESHGVEFRNNEDLVLERLYFEGFGDEALQVLDMNSGASQRTLIRDIECFDQPGIAHGGACLVASGFNMDIENFTCHGVDNAPVGTCTDGDGCPNRGKCIAIEAFSGAAEQIRVSNLRVYDRVSSMTSRSTRLLFRWTATPLNCDLLKA
jgi:hypothetical protein